MRLGKSVPWPDALEAITGQRRMDASALREYFRPLETWLREENARTGEAVGWESDGPVPMCEGHKSSLKSVLYSIYGAAIK